MFFRDKTAKLWDIQKLICLKTITHTVDVRSVFFNNFAIFTGEENSDLFVWDFQKALQSKETESNEGLLLRTLTGHGGLVHSVYATSFGLISCDISGLIIERDFWKCVEVILKETQVITNNSQKTSITGRTKFENFKMPSGC